MTVRRTHPPTRRMSESPDIDQLRRQAEELLAAYRAQVQDYCNRRGIGYLFTTTQTPFDRLVLNYFRQRGLLR